MPSVELRKQIISVEETWHEGGPVATVPNRRASGMIIIKNPFAGRYVEDIQPFIEDLKPFGLALSTAVLAALGCDASDIEGYGKGAIIGEAGELEHGALWHPAGGYAMRALLNGTKAIVPSTKKVGGVGARLDVPITHANASYVRSHFDAMEVGCNDAPRADELAYILVMSTGPRVHSRSGGLEVADVIGEDGQK